MFSFIRFGYSYIQYAFDYVFGFWPMRWLMLVHTYPATEDTRAKVNDIIQQLYQHRRGEGNIDLDRVSRDILQLNFHENVSEIKDEMHGFDILQHCIVLNQSHLVDILLKKLPHYTQVRCNSPAHLAATVGHIEVLKSIVNRRPFHLYKRAGLCYPDLHEPVANYRRMGFMFKDVFKCEEERLLPVEWAIVGDHVDCVQWMIDEMQVMGGRKFNLPKFLHFASQRGAAKCIDFFIKHYPEYIDHVNKCGDVPLLEAVVWGRKCSKVLIENGANVNKVARNGDTALHRLYRNDIDGIFAIYDTTKYLLTTGIEQLVNTINLRGETALHLLVTHVSYIGGNYYHQEHRVMPRWQIQPNYQEQVIQTLKLLLSFNADPHIYDALHLQPLNKLLHVTMKASRPNDKFECVQGSINSKYIYRNDFKSLARAMQVLVENGADVNTQCSIGHTPLILLIQTFLNTEVVDLVQESNSIIDAVDLLLKNGAKCNFISEDQKTCCSLLAELAKKIFKGHHGSRSHQPVVQTDIDLRKKYARLVNEILVIFLRYGLNPNYTTTKKSTHLAGGGGNSLIEFVRLLLFTNDMEDFEMIHTWLKTLLQWGADPDLEPYPPEPVICHSQSSIYLKKHGTQAVSLYIQEVKILHESHKLRAIFETGQAEVLLNLFYNTMEHKYLYDCLGSACMVARASPIGNTENDLMKVLNKMAENPRSLKQMSRVSIYKALGRKLFPSVGELPLPNAMKEYLLEIQ